MFATVLKCYFKFYKTFAFDLKSFDFKMQICEGIKETENEKELEQKKGGKGLGEPLGPDRKRSPWPI
jgi:hypothetical protein